MSTNTTLSQDQNIFDLISGAIQSMNLSEEETQKLIERSRDLKNEIQLSVHRIIERSKVFGPAIAEFDLKVPDDYDHDSQIDRFNEVMRGLGELRENEDVFTSERFKGATNHLNPGQTYKVKIFPIIAGLLSSEECLEFLKEQKAILVGAQGLTLAYEWCPDEFPIRTPAVSFDERHVLWLDRNHRRVPMIEKITKGLMIENLGYFDIIGVGGWSISHCLLCFCEE